MKTQALKQALEKYGFTAAFGGGRRDEENQEQKNGFFLSAMKRRHGIPKIKNQRCGICIIHKYIEEKA